ncbi:Gfo/Idh/MocA family protein [Domibacillus indicus]|uniref:Gfo/Idh/MocA family protein n=1 Tax=Domibacillus indicus TaxID=1437523 RepID=UPI000618150C|nr:Gfo/Idh/MocA family oxidoreductase [Domibacillus indicus]
MTNIRWGILGCAAIAKQAVIPGIQKSATGIVKAIASRTIEKAEEAAAELGIETAYGSYEELLADPNIDAVYIPLPNHLHREWTIRAAEAGKHVLCEKPAALNAGEAEEMKEACEKAKVLFAEAFMYRYHPRYQTIREIIQSGEIGEVRSLHGTFMFNNAEDKQNVRFKKDWGGGSLYDIGVYPLSAARLLLEEEPSAVSVHAQFSPEHDHVDMMASGVVEFPGGTALTFQCGMWAHFQNELSIAGTKGRIDIPSAFITHQNREDFFFVSTESGRREVEVPIVNQYTLQADVMGRCIEKGEPLPFNASDAVLNMRVLDACLTSAREKRRVELEES